MFIKGLDRKIYNRLWHYYQEIVFMLIGRDANIYSVCQYHQAKIHFKFKANNTRRVYSQGFSEPFLGNSFIGIKE